MPQISDLIVIDDRQNRRRFLQRDQRLEYANTLIVVFRKLNNKWLWLWARWRLSVDRTGARDRYPEDRPTYGMRFFQEE